MKAKDAKELVREFHEHEASKELNQTLVQIEQLAKSGKTEYFTYFNYEKNVDALRDMGYNLTIRSKVADHAEEKYVTYYDINWREDV